MDDAICKKIKLEEEIFPFGELLPEMQGEARDRMSPLALALFALTSKVIVVSRCFSRLIFQGELCALRRVQEAYGPLLGNADS